MGRAREYARRIYQRHIAFFREARPEIDQANLHVLRYAASAVLVLLPIYMALAMLTIRGWVPSPVHLACVPFAVLLLVIAWKLDDRRAALVMPACTLFEVALYAFAIAVDTAGGPTSPGMFMPLASVALTSLFVLPTRVTYGLLVAAQAVYILMVQATKDPLVGEYDIFQAVSGLVLALVISSWLMAYHTVESESRRAAEHLSDQDTLSDLLNKRAFFERARAVIERGDWLACTLAIIDLDDFKLVNDTFGHKAGDTALIDLGDILRSSFRPGDVIGRFGGDEFILLLVGHMDANALTERLHRVRETYARATAQDLGTALTCSIGAVQAAGNDLVLDELIVAADRALYAAKRSGKDGVCVLAHTHDGAGAPAFEQEL